MSDTELLHDPKTGPVHRLEVFTGTGRRRAWTAEQKVLIVAESHAGGLTVSAVARRHGLTPQQLFGWRRYAARPSEDGAPGSAVVFAPVIVTAPARSRPGVQTAPAIEVIIGAMTVRVPMGADLPTLQVVLRAARTVS